MLVDNLKSRVGFRTSVVDQAVKDLFLDGPLTRIFNDEGIRLTPAKGGALIDVKDSLAYSNQTYFSHVLNVTITAAILFEEDNLDQIKAEEEKGLESSVQIKEAVRSMLLAGVLHDFDKIVKKNYPDALLENKEILNKLTGNYLGRQELIEDVKFLICATEGSDSGFSNNYAITLPGYLLMKLQTYLEAGDRLAGYHGISNTHSYSIQLDKIKKNISVLQKVKIITIAPRVQSLLTGTLRQKLMGILDPRTNQKSRVVHEGTDFISYIGEELTNDDFEKLDELLYEATALTLDEAFEQSTPSHNSIKWNWVENSRPTPDTIKEFVYKWKGRLVIWQIEWFVAHADLFSQIGIPFKIIDGKPRLDVPDNLNEAPDAIWIPSMSVICASLALDLDCDLPEKVNEYIDNMHWPINGLNTTILRTIRALGWGAYIVHQENGKDLIEDLVGKISSLASEKYPEKANPLTGFSKGTIVRGSFSVIKIDDASEKKTACYQCQAPGTYLLEASRVQGYGAQNSTGIKLTKNSDIGKGKLCDWCVAENRLRIRYFSSKDSGIALHVHMADYTPDIPKSIFELFPVMEDMPIDAQKGTVSFLQKGRGIRMDGHMTSIVQLPGGSSMPLKVREGMFLRSLYNIVHQTGMKVHASSLVSNPQIPLPILFWENAPSWVKNLGLDEARIDEIPGKRKILHSLFLLGRCQGGSDGFGNFVISFIRYPQHLYFAFNRAYYNEKMFKSEKMREQLAVLETEFMDDEKKNRMEDLGAIGVSIAPSKQWSANEHRWVMQEALRAYDLSQNRPRLEKADFITAQISAYAQRFNANSNTAVIDQKSREFVDRLLEYLDLYHSGEVPTGVMRSYLINHYAYEYRKMYRIVRPKKEDVSEEVLI